MVWDPVSGMVGFRWLVGRWESAEELMGGVLWGGRKGGRGGEGRCAVAGDWEGWCHGVGWIWMEESRVPRGIARPLVGGYSRASREWNVVVLREQICGYADVSYPIDLSSSRLPRRVRE